MFGVHFEVPTSSAAPGVIDAILGAETVLVCPSNPVISIAPILAVAGCAMRSWPRTVIGWSASARSSPVVR